jgi:hypothetical protein
MALHVVNDTHKVNTTHFSNICFGFPDFLWHCIHFWISFCNYIDMYHFYLKYLNNSFEILGFINCQKLAFVGLYVIDWGLHSIGESRTKVFLTFASPNLACILSSNHPCWWVMCWWVAMERPTMCFQVHNFSYVVWIYHACFQCYCFRYLTNCKWINSMYLNNPFSGTNNCQHMEPS